MTRQPEKKRKKVPRKVAVRRSATRNHQNKYAEKSTLKHGPYGVRCDYESDVTDRPEDFLPDLPE
jgi:hypothetical protein